MNDQDDDSWKSLPLDEQINNKLWKARLYGYQQLLTRFKQNENSILDSNSELNKYWQDSSIYEKLILDTNVAAQEVAIQSLKQLCEICIPKMDNLNDSTFIEQHLQNWLLPLVNKGLTSTRSLSVQNSMDCILLIVSMDSNVQRALNVLVPNFNAKVPKQILQTILAFNKLLINFRLVNMESNHINELLIGLSGFIPKLASHADPKIRTNSMQLINILFNLLGRDRELLDGIIIDKLKNMQQRELNKLFDKEFKFDNGDGSDIIMFENDRRIKIEREQNQLDADGDTNMDLFDNMNNKNDGNSNNQGSNSVTNLNKLDLLPMESILNEMPENFNSRIQDDIWKERVEALVELNDNVIKKAKRFNDNEDYSHLINQLTDIISNDVNLQCVSLSVEILSQLLNKSKKQQYMIFIIFNKILDRTKEKKKNVIDGIVDLLHDCCKIMSPILNDEMLLEIVKRFTDKIPQVRLEMIKLFTYVICGHDEKGDTVAWGIKYKSQFNQIWEKYGNNGLINITNSIWHVINDQQPNVREESFILVSQLIKLIGYDKFQDILDKLDKIKRKKIETKLGQLDKDKANNNNSNIGNRGTSKLIPVKRIATSPLKNSGSPIELSHGIELNGSNKLRGDKLTVGGNKPNLAHSLSHNSSDDNNGNINKQTITKTTNLTNRLYSNFSNGKTSQQRISKNRLTSPTINNNNSLNNNNFTATADNEQLYNRINKLGETVKMKDAEISQLRNRLTELEQKLHLRETELKKLQLDNSSNNGYGANNINNIVSPINSSSSMIPVAAPMSTSPLIGHNFHGNSGNNTNTINSISGHRDSISDDLPNRVNELKIVTTEESWQRAAEVTRQLKERIERMKRRR